MSPSKLTKYCACHTEWLACLIVVTYETSFTMRGATGVTIQPHQILRLPHRMTRMLDRRHIWNVISNARSNRCHHPTSLNTAPATQNDSHAWSSSHMKRHLQCAEQQVSPSNLTKYCACHTEWLACLIVVTYETSFTMRGATGVTIKPYQIPRLPHKMTRMLDRRHIWNVTYNARSSRCHHPTSPNSAPATQNESHAWSSLHMKPHFQCAEQQVSRSNLSKYCACHTEWLACLIVVTYETSFTMRGATGITIQPHQILRLPRKMTLQDFKENLQKQVKRHFQCGADPTMIRPWSEHDPSMIRPWKRKPQPASQVSLLFEVPRSIFYCKIQRFAPNLTFKPSPNTAPTTKRYTWPSPSAAPTTKNKSYAWSSLHMKPHFQCAEQQVSRSNLTKYCACHEKWHWKISKKISKNRWNVISNAGPIRPWSDHDPSMIRPWKRKPQPASQVSLLFEVPRSIFYCKIQRFAPNLTFKPSPNTAPTTKRYTWPSPSAAPATKSDTWTSPSTAPATKSDITNFSKYCTCHEKWHLNFTKYCACHCTVTELYCTLLYLTLLYLTLLYVTLLYLTLLYLTLLYLTLLDTTLLDTTLRDTTLLGSYSTWLYSTWPAPLDLTLLRCRSYIGSFST